MSIRQLLQEHTILNIAHRGARSLAPENTLAAALKALEVGAHMWELDVGMTLDGELIVIHDATLQRTSDAKNVFPERQPWNVHEFTLQEIGRLDFGSWFIREDPFGEIRAGRISRAQLDRLSGLRAPTLAQALHFTRQYGWYVNVEIKDLSGTPGHPLVVPKVVSLINAMNLHGTVLISSFNHHYLEQISSLDAAISLGVLTNRRLRDPLKTLRRLGALAYHPRISAFAPKDVRILKNEGFHTLVWVANDPETFLRLQEEQVSGVFTDFPQNLAPMLR